MQSRRSSTSMLHSYTSNPELHSEYNFNNLFNTPPRKAPLPPTAKPRYALSVSSDDFIVKPQSPRMQIVQRFIGTKPISQNEYTCISEFGSEEESESDKENTAPKPSRHSNQSASCDKWEQIKQSTCNGSIPKGSQVPAGLSGTKRGCSGVKARMSSMTQPIAKKARSYSMGQERRVNSIEYSVAPFCRSQSASPEFFDSLETSPESQSSKFSPVYIQNNSPSIRVCSFEGFPRLTPQSSTVSVEQAGYDEAAVRASKFKFPLIQEVSPIKEVLKNKKKRAIRKKNTSPPIKGSSIRLSATKTNRDELFDGDTTLEEGNADINYGISNASSQAIDDQLRRIQEFELTNNYFIPTSQDMYTTTPLTLPAASSRVSACSATDSHTSSVSPNTDFGRSWRPNGSNLTEFAEIQERSSLYQDVPVLPLALTRQSSHNNVGTLEYQNLDFQTQPEPGLVPVSQSSPRNSFDSESPSINLLAHLQLPNALYMVSDVPDIPPRCASRVSLAVRDSVVPLCTPVVSNRNSVVSITSVSHPTLAFEVEPLPNSRLSVNSVCSLMRVTSMHASQSFSCLADLTTSTAADGSVSVADVLSHTQVSVIQVQQYIDESSIENAVQDFIAEDLVLLDTGLLLDDTDQPTQANGLVRNFLSTLDPNSDALAPLLPLSQKTPSEQLLGTLARNLSVRSKSHFNLNSTRLQGKGLIAPVTAARSLQSLKAKQVSNKPILKTSKSSIFAKWSFSKPSAPQPESTSKISNSVPASAPVEPQPTQSKFPPILRTIRSYVNLRSVSSPSLPSTPAPTPTPVSVPKLPVFSPPPSLASLPDTSKSHFDHVLNSAFVTPPSPLKEPSIFQTLESADFLSTAATADTASAHFNTRNPMLWKRESMSSKLRSLGRRLKFSNGSSTILEDPKY